MWVVDWGGWGDRYIDHDDHDDVVKIRNMRLEKSGRMYILRVTILFHNHQMRLTSSSAWNTRSPPFGK